MSARVDAEKTYRAIGRFVFEFSQVEYTIRHYLASEIDLKEEYFTAVMESYDVALLCAVASLSSPAARDIDIVKYFDSNSALPPSRLS